MILVETSIRYNKRKEDVKLTRLLELVGLQYGEREDENGELVKMTGWEVFTLTDMEYWEFYEFLEAPTKVRKV